MSKSVCYKKCRWQDGYRKGYYDAMVEVCQQRQEGFFAQEVPKVFVVSCDARVEGVFSALKSAVEYYDKIEAHSRSLIECAVWGCA